jgi:hypothetical protein
MAAETEEIAAIGRVGRGSPRGVGPLFQILTARDWLTLAVVSAEDGARAWWLVQALEQISVQAHQPLRTLNVLEATAARATAMVHALSPARLRAAGAPRRYLVATDNPAVNPAALAVLTACDGVLLLVQEGRTPIPGARRLVELIGRQRLIGAVLGSW